MTPCAIYLRVSTDRQANEGDSISAQRDAIRTYIDERSDLICVGEYVDDGVSGTKADRDELSRLLDDVRAGKVERILFTKLDRWFRSVRHYTATQAELDKHNVGWTAIWEPIYDTTTPQGRLIVNQMMSIAQFEAENTGQRIRQVFAYKISQGEVVTGSCPLGYSIENKHLVPNDDAPMVADLFCRYNLNNNLYALSKYARDVYGINRDKAVWKLMLKNTKYIGVWRGNDHYCTPIVDRDVFDAVQRKLSMNIKTGKKYEYIFSGLVRCAVCGHKYKGGRFKTSYRYRCAHHATMRGCSNGATISEKALEDYLLKNVDALLKDRELTYKVEQKKQLNRQGQIDRLVKKRDRLKELYLNEIIGIEEYRRDREQIDADIDACEALRAPAPHKPIDLPKDFKTLYTGFSVQEKRYLWSGVIKEIRVKPDRTFDIIFL